MFTVKPLFFSRTTPTGPQPYQHLDAAMQMVIDEAEKHGMHWELLTDSDVVAVTYKGKTNYFRNRAPSTTHVPATKICQNKAATSAFLRKAGVCVVKSLTVYSSDSKEYLQAVWDTLAKPLVIKPAQGMHGDAVHVGIADQAEYFSLIQSYFVQPLYGGGLVIEEMFSGKEYRIMVTQEKVLAVIERIPAFVTGDGEHTIRELIKLKNQLPIRNVSQDIYPHIKIDDDLLATLKRQEKDIESVPTKDETIHLRRVSNVMAGGETVDRTDEIHPSVAKIAMQTIQAIPGLSWAGIDFMTTDLFSEQNENSYRIIEVNAAPEFDMHELPMQGKARPVSFEFLKLMFPDLS
ncbi:MAG: hypothetical protein ABI758_02705 [Candidatus Woesebacteria bacterium]